MHKQQEQRVVRAEGPHALLAHAARQHRGHVLEPESTFTKQAPVKVDLDVPPCEHELPADTSRLRVRLIIESGDDACGLDAVIGAYEQVEIVAGPQRRIIVQRQPGRAALDDGVVNGVPVERVIDLGKRVLLCQRKSASASTATFRELLATRPRVPHRAKSVI